MTLEKRMIAGQKTATKCDDGNTFTEPKVESTGETDAEDIEQTPEIKSVENEHSTVDLFCVKCYFKLVVFICVLLHTCVDTYTYTIDIEIHVILKKFS